MPVHIVLALLFILITYKFGDWKNWKNYYSTMLFFAFGDLMYKFIFNGYKLWIHNPTVSFVSQNQVDLIWIIIIYPCTILLFLPCYFKKKSIKSKINYFLLWIAAYSLLELTLFFLGCIVYYNGWSFYWSIAFYFILFPILALHHRKPLWALLVSAACGISLMYIFLGTIAI